MPQRLVWLAPGVSVALPAPLFAASTSHEPAVETLTEAEIVVPEVAFGGCCRRGALRHAAQRDRSRRLRR